MKKIILLIMCLLLCNISANAKTIKYKSDNLLKSCIIKTSKAGYSSGYNTWNHNIYLEIEGKLVNTNNEPVINKKINVILLNCGKNATIYSNENGFFSYKTNVKIEKTYEKNMDLEILLEFNDKNKYEFTATFESGNDVLVTKPHEIHIKLDMESEYSLYFSDKEMIENIVTLNNKDIIILSSQTFSAQYYRDKIATIHQANEILKKAGLQIAAETIILDENKNLKKDWNNIINAIISADKMLKKAGLQIAAETIILDEEENLKSNWKEVVQQEINKERNRQNKIKRKRRIVEYPDSCNLTYKDEDEIFDAVGYTTNLRGTITSLMEVPDGRWISSPVQIMQVVGNKKFLFTLGNGQFVFYGILKNCCRNTNFYDGEWVDIAATIEGTFTYTTVLYGTKTVPKVKVYAIRPSVVMQNRYY